MIEGDIITARSYLFKALSDRTRLEIIELLNEKGPLTVTELCEALKKEQNLISHHLACLRNCGLVRNKKNGKNVIYSLKDKRVLRLFSLTDAHVRKVLESVLTCDVVKKEK